MFDKKSRPFLLAFIVTLAVGGFVLLLMLLAGSRQLLADLNPLPTVVRADGNPPLQIGYTPIPLADWTLTPSPIRTNTVQSFKEPTKTRRPSATPYQPSPSPTPWDGLVHATQTPRFRWVDLPAVGLRLELPDDWSYSGENFETECGQFGGPLTRYTLTSLAGDFVELDIMCPPITHMRLGPCYDPIILDKTRQIYRFELTLPLVTYSGYAYDKGVMQCPMLGWPVGDKYVLAAYYNRTTFEPNYPVMDRIMLSIREK